MKASPVKRYLIASSLLLLVALAAWAWRRHAASSQPHTIVFVVLDTVRADHLSLCGYGRPTTPTLEALVARGAKYTCQAYAPSNWTLPSHASFFTGRFPDVHNAGNGPGTERLFWGSVNPLGPELPTLAEKLADRGYQTVLVSGNPLLNGALGLTRGFEAAEVATGFTSLRGKALPDLVEAVLDREADPSKPLFLSVNIIDAHEPWSGVPEGMTWVPPRPPMLGVPVNKEVWEGRVQPEQFERILVHRKDVYDYGVWLADRALGALLDGLHRGGWLSRGFRLVVVSDHGEYLGEHHLLGHKASRLGDPETRVPLLYWGSDGGPEIPPYISALSVHDLLERGALPQRPHPVLAAQWVNENTHKAPCMLATAALWSGSRKITCFKGELRGYDLATDPNEDAPQQVDPSDADLLLRYSRRLDNAWLTREEPDEGLSQMLRSLGYLGD